MSDPILIPSTFDGSPMGPTNAVDMVVSSVRDPSDSVNLIAAQTAAKTAADAVIAMTAVGATTPDASMLSLSSPNSNGDKRRLSRPKIVAAKSVLLSKPNTERKTNALKRGKEEMLHATTKAKESQNKTTKKSTHTVAKVAKKSTQTVAKKSNKAKETKSASSPATRKSPSSGATASNEVFSGVPNEKFEYSWAGWTKKTFTRQSGKTAGSTDSYWYTPHMKYKLRSLTEIRRFHLCMEKNNNDEVAAFRALKGN